MDSGPSEAAVPGIAGYAAAAGEPGDAEGWIRKNQLIVLMYECIVGEGEASARAPPVVC